jgi:hypothetical protein
MQVEFLLPQAVLFPYLMGPQFSSSFISFIYSASLHLLFPSFSSGSDFQCVSVFLLPITHQFWLHF